MFGRHANRSITSGHHMPEIKLISKYRLLEKMDFDFPFSIFRYRHPVEDQTLQFQYRRNFWKLVYVISGDGVFKIDGREYPLRRGMVLFTHPQSVTGWGVGREAIEIYNLCFLPDLIADRLEKLKDKGQFYQIFKPDFQFDPERDAPLYFLSATPAVKRIFQTMDREYRTRPYRFQELFRTRFFELILLLESSGVRQVKKLHPVPVAETVRRYIETHAKSGVDYEELCRMTGLSRSRLGAVFRRETGGNISSTLLEYRLNLAAELLRAPEKIPLLELCYRCGFHDISYFYRCFQRKFGQTPLHFRNLQ